MEFQTQILCSKIPDTTNYHSDYELIVSSKQSTLCVLSPEKGTQFYSVLNHIIL